MPRFNCFQIDLRARSIYRCFRKHGIATRLAARQAFVAFFNKCVVWTVWRLCGGPAVWETRELSVSVCSTCGQGHWSVVFVMCERSKEHDMVLSERRS